jgi:6-pyruvoyltetrahydropterin/6-carboxytetrahydropterin synthase
MISASHRLETDALTNEQNRAVYGKCNNPYGHGHNYALEVTVSGQVSEDTGMVCDLVDLDAAVGGNVVERFDHHNLNALAEFKDLVPTTENFAAVIYDILKQRFTAAHLEKVRIEETSMNSFEYRGGAEVGAELSAIRCATDTR